jgi:hypothetical protein
MVAVVQPCPLTAGDWANVFPPRSERQRKIKASEYRYLNDIP